MHDDPVRAAAHLNNTRPDQTGHGTPLSGRALAERRPGGPAGPETAAVPRPHQARSFIAPLRPCVRRCCRPPLTKRGPFSAFSACSAFKAVGVCRSIRNPQLALSAFAVLFASRSLTLTSILLRSRHLKNGAKSAQKRTETIKFRTKAIKKSRVLPYPS